DLEVVVWTYEEEGTILPEASAHVWIPVRKAVLRGIEEVARHLAGGSGEQGPTAASVSRDFGAGITLPVIQCLEPAVLSTQRQPAVAPRRTIRIVDLL
ncbi:MAG TPA: hypothetical protein PLO53_09715, partial [Candidatus Hydrogenedentes bacterium]|nr:hypothetical protein [Candidatus Hydrogenedentota bacterium]